MEADAGTAGRSARGPHRAPAPRRRPDECFDLATELVERVGTTARPERLEQRPEHRGILTRRGRDRAIAGVTRRPRSPSVLDDGAASSGEHGRPYICAGPLASRTSCCRSRSRRRTMVSCARRCPLQRPRRVGVRGRRPATRPPTSSGSGPRGVATPSTSSVADAPPPAVRALPRRARRRAAAPARPPEHQGTHMHRPWLPRLRAALVLAFVAVLALSACSRREDRRHRAAGRSRRVRRRHPGRRAAPRLLPEHHPRAGADRRGQRLLPAGAGLARS